MSQIKNRKKGNTPNELIDIQIIGELLNNSHQFTEYDNLTGSMSKFSINCANQSHTYVSWIINRKNDNTPKELMGIQIIGELLNNPYQFTKLLQHSYKYPVHY